MRKKTTKNPAQKVTNVIKVALVYCGEGEYSSGTFGTTSSQFHTLEDVIAGLAGVLVGVIEVEVPTNDNVPTVRVAL